MIVPKHEWSLDGSLQSWSYNTWIGHLR